MNKKHLRNIIVFLFILCIGTGSVVLWFIFGPQVKTRDHQPLSIFLPEKITYKAVEDTLLHHQLIKHPLLFDVVARLKHYPPQVRTGHYVIHDNISYNQLINMLRAGLQAPVMVTFNHQRSLEEMAGIVSRQLAFDSAALMDKIHDQAFCQQMGFDTLTIAAIFIPNTYECYWNISAATFMERMKKEYEAFWTPERKQRATKKGLTPLEVTILASIVEEETWHPEEMPVIAGVYLNRMKKGMRLQADPTVKFAIGDISKRRILTKDLEIDSPYNTYRYKGLPPGPITLPSIKAVEAVLNAENHTYLYFCAKEDFSGYHYFSKTLTEHNRYAYRYRQALNRNRVYH